MKGMKLLCFSVLFMFLFAIPMMSAIDTEIKIKTMPFHEVQVSVSKPMSQVFESWGNLKNHSDRYGDVSFVFSSDKYSFDLIVFIKKDNEKVMPPQKFLENFPAGEPIYFEIAPSGFTLIETPSTEIIEEVNVTENVTIGGEGEDSQLTGSAIFGEDGLLSGGKIYYITGGLLLLIAAFFIFKIIRKKIKFPKSPKQPKEIKIKKLSELEAEKKEDVRDDRKIIEDAEKKIKEAQEDIRKLRSEDKIKEAKKKIIEDEKELMRLRSGKE
ncbi:hypothetical protein KAR52_00730 [Candidatus Pacearchaeota archaeon]|nr:hypothetical protein [Candidatus Pacearchaeota archaeon]